jgi:hypothetical protein
MERTVSTTLEDELIEPAAEPSGDLWAIPTRVDTRTIGVGNSLSQRFQ